MAVHLVLPQIPVKADHDKIAILVALGSHDMLREQEPFTTVGYLSPGLMYPGYGIPLPGWVMTNLALDIVD